MKIAVAQETFPSERRVALVPATVPSLTKAGLEVLVQSGAGQSAGFPDKQYVDKGAKIAATRDEAFAADILLQVRAAGANREAGAADLPRFRAGTSRHRPVRPARRTRGFGRAGGAGRPSLPWSFCPASPAQSMDVLSSQATIAGYRAVLLAATALPKMFPMLMTAAGTIAPAKVFVVGAGVAGLQAIATASRLGGVVSAYDVRPAVKEQVQSLGAKFVEMALETAAAETKGGYAQQMDEEFYRKQRELMGRVVGESDVVITTAAVPGKKAPVLVTAAMVAGMAPGSVVVDLAAERGGNCELTEPGKTVVHNGVTILGPLDLPAEIPYHASQLYSKNISTFLLSLIREGKLHLDLEDEVVSKTMAARDGRVVEQKG